jgi:hypothetical protein
MEWKPPEKFIHDINTIRVKQALKKGGDDIMLPEKIGFKWENFLLSVIRTRSLRTQIEGIPLEDRAAEIHDYGFYIASSMNVCIDKTTQEFSFTKIVYNLPDDERPSVAGNVGAAVADLIMEKLGYHWRANAGELKLIAIGGVTVDTKRTPDYVYDPGKQHGFDEGSVVIVEAKGSLSPKRAETAPIKRLARKAYKRQVHDFIGSESEGLIVASGYAVAFGAVPGTQSSRIAIASPQKILVNSTPVRQPAPLSAAATGSGMFVPTAQEQQQTEQQQAEAEQVQVDQVHVEIGGRRGGGGGDDGGERRREGERARPSGRIAFANYENVFLLCGATNAAAFLRHILSDGSDDFIDSDALIQEFVRLDLREPILVGSRWSAWPCGLGIYEPSARSILEIAANNRLSPPPTVELAIAPVGRPDLPVREDPPRPELVMQGDGLAWFYLPPRRYSTQLVRWDLEKGGWV